MRCGHLFNGVGGFPLATSWMGWENVFHCEINPFCNKIMNRHFPNSIQYEDIQTTDFTIWRGKIDVLTGGFPCQPFSVAGEQLGKEHEQYLLEEMLRAFDEIRPTWGVGENVPGITSPKFGDIFSYIHTSLESKGYKVQAFDIPATAVEAVHERRRIWFIAYAGGIGLEGREQGVRKTQKEGFDSENSTPRTLQPSRLRNHIPPSRIFRGTNGVSKGVDRIHALGNAIVPQVAYELFKTIEQFGVLHEKSFR